MTSQEENGQSISAGEIDVQGGSSIGLTWRRRDCIIRPSDPPLGREGAGKVRRILRVVD